jgi:DNA polymerase elongation subunit (family B)
MDNMNYTNISYQNGQVLLRTVDHNGKKSQEKQDFLPEVFVMSGDATSPYRDIYDNALEKFPFKSHHDLWTARKSGQDLYGDINPYVQYISKTWSGDIDYNSDHVRVFTFDIEVDHDENFPDPMRADKEVTSIALHDSKTDTMYIWALEYDGCTPWRQDIRFDGKYTCKYQGFKEESALLGSFIDFWTKNYPDILTGWFIDGFDIPYLINRINNIFGEDTANVLSPWGIIKARSASGLRNAGVNLSETTTYDIVGISSLDYIIQYKKYSYTPQSSYKLGHIAYAELGDGKLDYSEVGSLPELYRTDFQKFVDYNIKDVDIVKRLDDKKNFIKLIIDMAYFAKVNFSDVSSPNRLWDSLIYNHLRQFNIQIPPDRRHEKGEKYAGAFVKEPQLGKFNWVMSIDLASLYPNMMRGINISPDTYAPYATPATEIGSVDDYINKRTDLSSVQDSKYSMAANNTFYDRTKEGFLPFLLTKLYNRRKAEKQDMLEHKRLAFDAGSSPAGIEHTRLADSLNIKQHAKKILMNSAYGLCGNQYFRWFNINLAEAITFSGQVAIQWIERKVNEYLNQILKSNNVDYVIAIDTDSLYINLNDLITKLPKEYTTNQLVDIVDQFYKHKLSKMIDAGYDELYQYMNHREQLMFMDRELIADVGVWCSKKHYFLRVFDEEGVRLDKPKTKISGMGFIKSDIPEVCRKKIKSLLPIVFDGTNPDLIAEMDSFKKEFYKMDINDIAKITGVSKIKKYIKGNGYISGTPIGSKSALIYNRLHAQKKLGYKHPIINEGDKIKYVWLIKNNPIGEETIGFIDFLPEEFELHRFIDWREMYQKSFLGPTEEILGALQWKDKNISNLSSFF